MAAARARGAGRRARALPWVVWVGVLAVGVSTWVLQVPVRTQMATDPLVGAGQLAQPAVAPPPDPVLGALPEPTGSVDPAALRQRLESLPRDGVGDVVGLVLDARTGEPLYRTGSGVRTPASSMKVLSGLVALDVLGPRTRFATTALLTTDGRLVLRGGGDPLLVTRPTGAHPNPASLAELADATAAALKQRGIASVGLVHDASRFAGPGWNPLWPPTFAQSVAPMSALTVDHGRPDPTSEVRSPDPAGLASERFAALLAERGIAVTARAAGTTPADATELARVESLPVAVLVGQSLGNSDNDAAETLLWQAALAQGRPATPTDAAAFLEKELRERGLWTEGMVVRDGNGIASENQVSPDALAGAIRAGLDDPGLRPLVTGLPVAGVSGTLTERFEAPDALAARGLVRAKTGTIRGVNTLTGYVVPRSGRPLVFCFMLSGGAGQTSARAWLDRATAALAS